ncbi:hypothetical protein MKW92_048218, partial [Papaver armeniacum]
VNRIRELPQNMKTVATSGSPNVLIWDVDSQPNRHAILLILDLYYARQRQVSGLWGIQDHISAAAVDQGSSKSPGPRTPSKAMVESFREPLYLTSCSAVWVMILWDARTGTSPTVKVEKAHNADLHCVDWNRHDENLTGLADNSVPMFDHRNLTVDGVGFPLYKFERHGPAVLRVQVCLSGTLMPNLISTLCRLSLEYIGSCDPWTIVSISDDCESSGGGGTFMSDLIYRPEEEVLEEVEKFKSVMLARRKREVFYRCSSMKPRNDALAMLCLIIIFKIIKLVECFFILPSPPITLLCCDGHLRSTLGLLVTVSFAEIT